MKCLRIFFEYLPHSFISDFYNIFLHYNIISEEFIQLFKKEKEKSLFYHTEFHPDTAASPKCT